MTSYAIPKYTGMGTNTKISQIWKDDIHIIGMTSTGVFVFDQYVDKKKGDVDPLNQPPCNRLCKVIGPLGIEGGMFNVKNGNILMTSSNTNPHWFGH